MLKDLSVFETTTSEKDIIYAFTDGGCKNNGKKYAIAGYSVFFTDDESSEYYTLNKSGLVIKDPTNQCAELTAISKCIENIISNQVLFNNKKIIIVTDSIYSINCVTKWSKNWKQNGWKNSKGEEIKNKNLIEQMVENYSIITQTIDLSFKHVFSHTKEPIDKNSMQYFLWYGNKKVDDNINDLLQSN